MIRSESAQIKILYYAFSVSLMLFFTHACSLAADTNLPPLKPLPRFIINVLLLHLLVVYYWVHRNGMATIARRTWPALLLVGAGLCTMPIVFSGDLHEYLIRGRILGVYHSNPYTHTSGEFPQDIFYPLSIWKNLPDNYGPAWTAVQWMMPTWFGSSVFLGVFSMKFFLFGFMILAGFLFHRIANIVVTHQALWMTSVFLLNPNLVTQTLVDGHNDIFMIVWALLALHLFLSSRSFWWVPASACAFLVKYSSGVLFPVLLVAALRTLPLGGRLKKTRYAFTALVLFAGTVALFYAPFWAGPKTFEYFFVFKDWFYTNSVPYAIHVFLSKIGLVFSVEGVKRFFMFFFALNCLGSLLWLILKKTFQYQDIFRALAWILISLHVSYAIPFNGHHLLWELPFLILSGFPGMLYLVTISTGVGLFAYFKRTSFLFLFGAATYAGFIVTHHWKARSAAV